MLWNYYNVFSPQKTKSFDKSQQFFIFAKVIHHNICDFFPLEKECVARLATLHFKKVWHNEQTQTINNALLMFVKKAMNSIEKQNFFRL